MFRRSKPETTPEVPADESPTAAAESEPLEVTPDTKERVADHLGTLASSVVSITNEQGETEYHLQLDGDTVPISEEEVEQLQEAQDVWQNPPPGSDPGA